MSEKSKDWWEYLRDEELKPALEFFPSGKNIKILEVGGGNGYQAMKISDMGYSIKSIDIFPREPLHYNVEKINVIKLPYPDQHFDLILTSLVLQHIEHIDSAFKEMNRVLKNDGIMIHIVPNFWWSIFTNFWHYCYIPKYLLKSISKKIKSKDNHKNKNDIDNSPNNNKTSKVKQLFFHPLGCNPSFIHEIFYFRKNNWIKKFEKYSLKVVVIKNCPIFSTGYGIFKNKFLKIRKFLALHYFPTNICIITKKI